MAKSLFDIKSFVTHRVDELSISCKSFIVTVFGDVISQHGGWIWLGSLIELLQPLGFSERLIRTSVYRLVQDDWLQTQKVGRKSFYAFTTTASRHYTKAARRIYADSSQHSDGSWLIIIPSLVSEEKQIILKRQLRWLGFSPLASGAYAHPSIEKKSLYETLTELELLDLVIVFESRTIDEPSERALKKLVSQKWNINELQQDYTNLVGSYSKVATALKIDDRINYQESLLLRLLLIHEYRRVLLKDHELPRSMLPDDWSGYTASHLVKNIYATLAKKSCHYICNHLLNMDGILPRSCPEFKTRFQ